MAATKQWYDYDITQGHATDDGADLGTPNDTPVWFPFDAQVIDASYHVYGGQVVAKVPGTDYSEYFIHLDNLYVKPGDTIHAGQIIGTTGGGLGDKIVHNGQVVPAQSMAWYEGHSSGYHTEYGIFEGQDMASFNQGWGQPARQLDPTSVIDDLRSGHAPQWPGTGTPQATGLTAGGGVIDAILTRVFPWLSGTAESIHFRLVSLQVGAAGVGFILLGSLFIYGATQNKTPVTVVTDGIKAAQDQGRKLATDAAKAAAVAAV